MYLYLLLEETDSNRQILKDNGFINPTSFEDIVKTQFNLYTGSYTAFNVSKTAKVFPNSVMENLTRIVIEPSQIPQIATLFNLGIYGEDLIPLLT